MLEVDKILQEKAIFPNRFFILKGNTESRNIFPIDEKHRDLLYLIMSLHYIELQEPKTTDLLLKTHYYDDFIRVKEDIEIIYQVLTENEINLHIEDSPQVGSQEKLSEKNSPLDCILLSGGVDSVAGAAKVLSEKKNKVLLHIASNMRVFGQIQKILSLPQFSKIYTYNINSRIKSTRDRGSISDTRGLLFLTSGYALNQSLGGDTVHFGENGAQMLDSMLDTKIYVNSVATKNTNLRYLHLIEELLKDFNPEATFKVDYIFKEKTKAELIAAYLSEDLIRHTWSCYNLHRSNMCGSCWNCFITKMSMRAANIPASIQKYEENPLIDNIKKDVFLDNQNIIYDLLVFYMNVLNKEKKSLSEIVEYSSYFDNPINLATSFGLDIYLGIKKSLRANTNGLGKKAEELLSYIDPSMLRERDIILSNLRTEFNNTLE